MFRPRSNRIAPTNPGGDPANRGPNVDQGPHWEAPIAEEDSPMNIPYRGAEMHGVPHTVEEDDYRIYRQKDDRMVQGEPVIAREIEKPEAIPVRIVDDKDKDTVSERPDVGFADKFVANRTEHTTQPFLLFGADPTRTSLVITNRSEADQIFYIGYDEGLNEDVKSWDLRAGETLNIQNTAAVYALCSAVGGILRIAGDRFTEKDVRK